MLIKIISNSPVNGQESISKYIGRTYETLSLKAYYNTAIAKEMNELKEVAVFLEDGDKQPSILNKNEYEIIEK